jgi:alkylhydroperoxidase/carboxymuconolactone decarboxylase family protein YurZ
MGELPRTYQRFKSQYHELWEAYDRLGAAAADLGPLDGKCRELIKLGMAAARQSESAVGITTIGFPAMMAAFSWSQMAIADHTS